MQKLMDVFNASKIVQFTFIFIVCMSFLLMAYWLDLRLLTQHRLQLIAQEKLSQTKYFALQKQLMQITTNKNQVLSAQQSLDQVMQHLTKANDIPDLLDQITKIGNAAGLHFKSIKPDATKSLDNLTVYLLVIALQGNYQQITRWVNQLATFNDLVVLQNFTLGSAQLNDRLEMQTTLKIYQQ